MAVGEFSPKDRYIKNRRLEVINLQGETGNPTHTAVINVTSSEQPVVISKGKRIMTLTNTGSKDCYYGASGLSSTTGTPIYSAGERVTFENVKEDFIVFVLTGGTDTTTLRRVEF